jgi:pimeloyl-ACP methyl ester carboxylesterase
VPETRLSRRSAVLLGASSAAAGFAAHLGAPAWATAQDSSATFVLVPGQWTGAFVWHTVVPLLRAAGHDVYAVTCTGLGDRVHLASPAIDLDVFITDVVNVLEYEDLHDVTLVGHSFAGMIITGVAERVPERLAQVIYFDACVPADGQTSYDADFFFPSEEDRQAAIAADIAGGMEAGIPGFRPVYPEVVEWLRGSIKDPAEADWFVAKLVPHPELTNLQPVELGNPAAAALPHAFILCTADKDLEADPPNDPYVRHVEQVRTDPNWRVVELADTHMANLNDPQATAQALLSLV